MANEFAKPSRIFPAIVGEIADPDVYNGNIGAQSTNDIVGIDDDGFYSDFNVGNEALTGSGSLVSNIKLRLGAFFKVYNAFGVFLYNIALGSSSSTTLGQSLLPKQVIPSNNIADPNNRIDFTAGNFIFDDSSGQGILPALTKRFNLNFSLGNNGGGLAAALTFTAGATYHIFQVSNPLGTICDIIADSSPVGANIATDPVIISNGLTKKQYLVSIVINSVPAIRTGKFIMKNSGYDFIYDLPVSDGTFINPGISANIRTLTLPTGINIYPLNAVKVYNGNIAFDYITTSLLQPDITPTSLISDITTDANDLAGGSITSKKILTNTSCQIRTRFSVSNSQTIETITTYGWSYN
jgi:hypothetical protein